MKKLLLATALYLSCGAASAAVINFDVDGLGVPIAAETPISNQYANLGVEFEGIDGGGPVPIVASPNPDGNPSPSMPNSLTNCSAAVGGCPGIRVDIVRITFSSGVADVSLMLDTLGAGSVTFNLYDSLDNLLETQSISSVTYGLVSFAAADVSRIDILQPNDGWAWVMDNLTFTSSVPPQPSATAVPTMSAYGVALTILGLLLVARRRIRSAISAR